MTTWDTFFNTLLKGFRKLKKEYPGLKLLIAGNMNATIGNNCYGTWYYLGPNKDDLETNDTTVPSPIHVKL